MFKRLSFDYHNVTFLDFQRADTLYYSNSLSLKHFGDELKCFDGGPMLKTSPKNIKTGISYASPIVYVTGRTVGLLYIIFVAYKSAHKGRRRF